MEPCAGYVGKCAEQTGGGTSVWIRGRMAGGSIRAAAVDDGGDSDGGGRADGVGQRVVAGNVLLFLFFQRLGIRMWRAVAEPSAVDAMVSQCAGQGHGHRVFGNWIGRRGGAVDLAFSEWQRFGWQMALRFWGFDYRGGISISFLCEGRCGGSASGRSAAKSSVERRCSPALHFVDYRWEHAFHRSGERDAAEFETVFDHGRALWAGRGSTHRCRWCWR